MSNKPAPKDACGIQMIRHVGVVVEDVEKELLFFRDLLGFEVYWDKIEHGVFIETILKIPSVRVRTIKMRSKNGCALELLRYDTSFSSEKKICQTGFTHIAITVLDLDQTYRFLKEKNIEFLSEPKISPDKKAKVAFCRDPEGNFLELVEELT